MTLSRDGHLFRAAAAGALLLSAIWTAPAFAQPRARLVVTVADPSGAVIPDATVTLVGLEDATRAAVPAPLKTTDKGIATLDGLAPGRYSIRAEFPGFDPGLLREVRLKNGDNRHVVILPLQKMQSEVTVGRDAQTAGSDRRNTFGTAMTREQIDALSDDPDEMSQQLQEMAGQNAVLRIDSFEGGKLPPKSQIKAIHITRDAFAAENHYAGGLFIDIITQPGIGPIRGGGNYRLRDGALNSRNPFTPTKGPERSQNFSSYVSGSLWKDKSSFSLSMSGTKSYDTPALNVALPGGPRSEALNLRRPRDSAYAYGTLDYALTRDQTLRLMFSRDSYTSENLGVGAYDLAERAYSSDEDNTYLRLQEAGPLGRRFFINTRLEFNRSTVDTRSVIEAPTIRVNDAFTSGGQQLAGGRDTKTVNLASDVDYVRGIHSVRSGISLNGGRYRTNDTSNYLGTYTFESLAAFEAGLPRSFTRRIGDPNIDYWNLQAGLYLQDDIRVSKTLTLSPGVRYEAQTHLNDLANVAPRFGTTWSPFKNGKTTLRASWGVFYDWLSSNTYEQSLRVNGFRQQEMNIENPAFPDPGDAGIVFPTSRYLLDDDLQMVRNVRASLGIEERITPRIRFGATYSDTHGSGLLRGRNLNAPIDGVRPDLLFGNIIEVVPDARSSTQSLSTSFGINLATPSPALSSRRFNWRRVSLNGGYTISRSRNDTDGAFSVPATGSLAADWGPSSGDVRHRLNAGINTQALKNLNAFVTVSCSSAPPYTVRTGRDDNGDQIFNDRPAGVGRNTRRASSQFTVNGNASYSVPFGKRKMSAPGGVMITSVGGLPTVSSMAPQEAPRYRLSFNLSVQNLTNRTNYGGYSGTLTSPFFGRPTTASGVRRVDVGMGFSF